MFWILMGAEIAIPAEPFRRDYEVYSACIEHYIAQEKQQIASASLLRDRAIAKCSAQRARLVERLSAVMPADAKPMETAAKAVELLERFLPGTIRETILLVPTSECPSRLKVRNLCLY